MTPKTRLYWALSAVLLIWAIIMTVISTQRARCLSDGMSFSLEDWACVSRERPIILQRDLQRS